MYSSLLLTEEEKTEYNTRFSSFGLKSMQDYGSRLRTVIKDDANFLAVLKDFTEASGKVFTSITLLRKNGVMCSPKVRQIMYQDMASSLASFGELFSQKKLAERIQRVADESLVSTLKQIGLLT